MNQHHLLDEQHCVIVRPMCTAEDRGCSVDESILIGQS